MKKKASNEEHERLAEQCRKAVQNEFGSNIRIFRRDVGLFRNYVFPDRLHKIGIKGQWDSFGFIKGVGAFEIEYKTGTGRLTIEQRSWQDMLIDFGIINIVVRSVEDAIEGLRPHIGEPDANKKNI